MHAARCFAGVSGLVDVHNDMKVAGRISIPRLSNKKISEWGRAEPAAITRTLVLYQSIFKPFAFNMVYVARGTGHTRVRAHTRTRTHTHTHTHTPHLLCTLV